MRNRRMICRIAFVLCGILPLMATLLYAGWRSHQYNASYLGNWLGRSLGCSSNIDQVNFVRPGIVQLVGVDLADAENQRSQLSCKEIEIHHTNDRIELQISNCVLHVAAADQIFYAIHEQVLKRPSLLDASVHVTIGTLDLPQSPGIQFVDCRLDFRQIERGSDFCGTEMRATFFPDQDAVLKEDGIELVIRRDRSLSQPTTILLDTGSHTLPTRLVTGLRSWLPCLNPDATFRGIIECHLADSGWSGDVLGGDFVGVDLETLLGPNFGGWIRGLANLRIETLKVEANRIRELRADVVSPSGKIDSAKLHQAVSNGQLVWDATPSLKATNVAYREMSLGIDVQAGEMTLRGRGMPSGTVLRLESGESLRTKNSFVEYDEPVTAIMSFLFGPEYPIESVQTDILRRILPLPTIPVP